MQLLKKIVYYMYGLLGLFFGMGLLLAPGRFLGVVGWAPVDPLLSRLLGAALLGMAWMAWRMVRSTDHHLVSLGVEMFLIFNLLGSIGLLRHLLVANWPFMVWALCVVLLVFSLIWVMVWFSLRKD